MSTSQKIIQTQFSGVGPNIVELFLAPSPFFSDLQNFKGPPFCTPSVCEWFLSWGYYFAGFRELIRTTDNKILFKQKWQAQTRRFEYHKSEPPVPNPLKKQKQSKPHIYFQSSILCQKRTLSFIFECNVPPGLLCGAGRWELI